MTKQRVLIIGHFFVHRLKAFAQERRHTECVSSLNSNAEVVFHGIGGKTISKFRGYDLDVVKETSNMLVFFFVSCIQSIRTSLNQVMKIHFFFCFVTNNYYPFICDIFFLFAKSPFTTLLMVKTIRENKQLSENLNFANRTANLLMNIYICFFSVLYQEVSK